MTVFRRIPYTATKCFYKGSCLYHHLHYLFGKLLNYNIQMYIRNSVRITIYINIEFKKERRMYQRDVQIHKLKTKKTVNAMVKTEKDKQTLNSTQNS